MAKTNPYLDNDKLYEGAKDKVENEAVVELTGNMKEVHVEKIEPKVEKRKTIIKSEKKGDFPVHPILNGQRDKTIVVYRNLLDLLRLLKITRPECDINETANQLILDGLESKGWLKELLKQQAGLKK